MLQILEFVNFSSKFLRKVKISNDPVPIKPGCEVRTQICPSLELNKSYGHYYVSAVSGNRNTRAFLFFGYEH